MAQPSQFKDHYKALGVTRDATDDEITSAYRRLMRELHSDVNPDSKNEPRLKEITEAYEGLGGNFGKGEERVSKRKEYDEEFTLHNRVEAEQKPHILVPDNDLGLLYALREAYRAKEPGHWGVNKSNADPRDWLRDEFATIRRLEDGSVHVYRVVQDWRDQYSRDERISYTHKPTTSEPHTRLHEQFLYGKGQDKIQGGGIINPSYFPPLKYGNYLKALKLVAKALADGPRDGKYNTGNALDIINDYCLDNGIIRNSRHFHIRREGDPVTYDNKDHEIARAIPLDTFIHEVNQAEGRVTIIPSAGKEGQQTSTAEGQHAINKEKSIQSPEGGQPGEAKG